MGLVSIRLVGAGRGAATGKIIILQDGFNCKYLLLCNKVCSRNNKDSL